MFKWLKNKVYTSGKTVSPPSPPKQEPPGEEIVEEKCDHQWIIIRRHEDRGICKYLTE